LREIPRMRSSRFLLRRCTPARADDTWRVPPQPSGIARLAEHWGKTLADDSVRRLEAYLALLLRWGARINLTGARSAEVLVGEHLPDSFALDRLVVPGAEVIDVGSGGGLPAVPFAILRPDCAVTLVEPRQKRVAFLRTAVRELGLVGVAVRDDRAEDLVGTVQADVASSRATFSPAEWLTLGRRLVRPSGEVIVFAASAQDVPPDAIARAVCEYEAGTAQRRWTAAFSAPG
jgi:16S rRNA (guanine527-N7)-methyltransferase